MLMLTNLMVGVDILRGDDLGTERGLADPGGAEDEDTHEVSLVMG